MYFMNKLLMEPLVDPSKVDPAVQLTIRFVYEHMRHVPMVDLAASLTFLSQLGDDRKILRYLAKVEELIELTNPKLLKQVEQ